MRFINCNDMSLAEDINKIKIRDPMSLTYQANLEDICVLIYKNINTHNIEHKIFIADTDLNALSHFMYTKTKLFVDNDLLVILRHNNIKELLKVANANLFSPKKQLNYVSLSFNLEKHNIDYNASNDISELQINSPLFILETDNLKKIQHEIKLIETGQKTKQEIRNIYCNNLRWMAPVDLNIEEIYQEINLVNFADNMIKGFIENFQQYKNTPSHIEMFNFYLKLVNDFKNRISNQYAYYQAGDIRDYLSTISLGRLDKETIEKANYIHNFYETQKESIFFKIDEMFEALNKEK